ncbi:long-chain fatty acid--CoA ligase [uncultured Aureimonas sp.]|uniref:AMP-dependent synthetase/ligase n=1 Tax=uncultured Aureimonas sp. TaxID=1604662 RepID=UPI0025FBA8A3|nr:AMP-binding protein [uncultured Aureimonas sp.]
MLHDGATIEAGARALHPDWRDGDTLIAALNENAEKHGSTVAVRERDRGIWQEWTWGQYRDRVLEQAAGFEAAGLKAGDIALVIGDNRASLYVAMLAVIALRAVPSPAYSEVAPEELAGQIRREGIRFAIAEDQEQVDKLLVVRETVPELATIAYDDPRGLKGREPPGVVGLEDLVAKGRERLTAESGLRDDLLKRARVHDVAVLLHSSGTTGAPKGIPLKHGHVLSGVRNAAAAGYFREGEVHMAYLPMAWVGDFLFSIAAAITLRFVVAIPERQETAQHDLREIAPTIYFSSPRAWSNMLTRVQVGMEESTWLKRGLFEHFVPFAVELERRRLEGREPSGLERLRWQVGRFLVFGPLLDQLGLSRVQRPYTAGEAIGEEVFLFFRALGLNLRQFYGQTENCALAVAQGAGDLQLHTVGRPFPGIEVRIDETGEILMRGDNVFDGYHGDEAASAKALDRGWLRTGDAGQVEPDGQIVVLGRVSEVVHTGGGTRYIPTYIENRLKFSPYIRDVCVVGRGRPSLAAIVCIDFEAVGHFAQENAVSYTSYADLSQKPEVLDLVERTIADLNRRLPAGLAITRFVNLHKEFDPDDGEVTRTRKLKRDVIDAHYAPIVEALYAGAGEIAFEARVAYETGAEGVLKRDLTLRTVGEGGVAA